MNLSFVENINSEYPDDAIVCLSDFDTADLKKFIVSILRVANDETVCLSKEDYLISSVIELYLQLSDKDLGIQYLHETTYVCYLTKERYNIMADLVRAFSIQGDNKIYQWLYDLNTPIDFLLSYDCTW